MISVQQLHRNTLITAQEVANVIAYSESLDLKRIQNNIIVAEERFIRALLGFDFYENLVAQKNVVITNDNKNAFQAKIDTAWGEGAYQLKVDDVVNDQSSLSNDNKILWKQHLWSIVAECVMVVSYPANYADFTNQGIVHNAPKLDAIGSNNKNTPELDTVKWQIDKMVSGRIDPLTHSFQEFICKNKDKYPLYEKSCDCQSTGSAYAGSSIILTGVYSDE